MDNDIHLVMSKVANNLLNTIAMGKANESWSDNFSYSEVMETYHSIKDQLAEMIDFTKLSKDELVKLGFKKWNENSESLLVPLWAFDLLEDGTELVCINGSKAIKGKDDIDLDVRFGCIAYGLHVNSTNL